MGREFWVVVMSHARPPMVGCGWGGGGHWVSCQCHEIRTSRVVTGSTTHGGVGGGGGMGIGIVVNAIKS
jgi:hypothetical protein